MRQIKKHLLWVALLGISAAWVNKPPQASMNDLHKFSFRNLSYDGTKWYFVYDLSSLGWIQGWDYDCYPSNATCSFMANYHNTHSDGTGQFVYSWDILASGTDNSGWFISYH